MIVLPTATLEVNERGAISGGAADQVFVATSYFDTSASPSKVGRFVPPIAYSCPWTNARPGVFLAIGMSASWSTVVQASVAMSYAKVFEATLYLDTSASPSKVGTFVPPIEYSSPFTNARPGVFFAIGISAN